MKKGLLIASVFLMSLVLFSQQIKEEATVINIEVPVRVFSGKTFVDNLTIDDFEVLENGVHQNIEAVYFIKKRSAPKTARNFFLFFELSEYKPKIADAIKYFVHTVLTPGDNLSFVTPMKTYRMKNIAFEVTSKEEITKQLTKIGSIAFSIGQAILLIRVEQKRFKNNTIKSFLRGKYHEKSNLYPGNSIINIFSLPSTRTA